MGRKKEKKEEVLFTDSGIIEKNADVFGVVVTIISFVVSFWLIFLGALAIMS